MKRELKVRGIYPGLNMTDHVGHKANPDEKGTESSISYQTHFSQPRICHKANPDEKGTESLFLHEFRDFFRSHKANPDEKGTESQLPAVVQLRICVTKPIPMKRELKGLSSALNQAKGQGHKANPDEKGTESWLQ